MPRVLRLHPQGLRAPTREGSRAAPSAPEGHCPVSLLPQRRQVSGKMGPGLNAPAQLPCE